ncbi:MAG: hypothetical protein ACRD0Z_01830 [Acidimicrobiales bacterium]
MTLLTISTVKGAPGGSTLGLLLARVVGEANSGNVPSRHASILAECDLCGGDAGPRLGLPGVPGLASLALAARHGLDEEVLSAHTQVTDRLPGTELLLGVAGPEQGVALSWMLEPLARVLANSDRWAIADLGRLSSRDDMNDVFRRGAAVNLLVTNDTVASLLHARAAVETFGRQGIRLELVVVGERTHPVTHISRTTGSSVVGTVRYDPPAVADLLSRRGNPPAFRSRRPWPRPTRAAGACGLRADVASVLKSLEGRAPAPAGAALSASPGTAANR